MEDEGRTVRIWEKQGYAKENVEGERDRDDERYGFWVQLSGVFRYRVLRVSASALSVARANG